MQLYVVNPTNLDIIGCIDSYISYISTIKTDEIGDFELQVPSLEGYLNLLSIGNFIVCTDNPAKFFIINNVEDKTGKEDFSITVSGSTADVILQRKLYPYWESSNNSAIQGDNPSIESLLSGYPKMNFAYFNLLLTHRFNTDTGTYDIPDKATQGSIYDLVMYFINESNTIQEETESSAINFLTFDFGYWENSKGFTVSSSFYSNGSIPVAIFSEDLENIEEVTVVKSMDGVANSCVVLVNTDWSGTMYQKQADGSIKEVTVSYNDLFNRYKTKFISYYSNPTDNKMVNVIEKTITVDPVVILYDVTTQGTAEKQQKEKIYFYVGGFLPPVEAGKYCAGVTVTPATGELRIKYVDKNDQEETKNVDLVYAYQVDQERTTKNAEILARRSIEPMITNIQGTVDSSRAQGKVTLGSIVVFRDDRNRIEVRKPVTEIQMSYDSSGSRMNLTFGEPLKTIFDILR